MSLYNCLTIDLSLVKKNLEAFQSTLTQPCRLLPMVKAEAYGAGARALTSFFMTQGIDIVGVSHLSEAIELRSAFPELAILIVQMADFDIEAAVANRLEIALCNIATAQHLNQVAKAHSVKVKVHLDINTGMQRFGAREEEVLPLARAIHSLSHLSLQGAMTHFVAAESREFDPITHNQIALFQRKVDEIRAEGIALPWIHAANSAGLLRHKPPFNMARIGIGYLGIQSSAEERQASQLFPALTLETKIVGINHCLKHEGVGYHSTYKAKKEKERLAVLPIGYFDGFHLHYSGKGYALIHGKKAPYVGRICMDFMMVDITEIPEAKAGDRVILFDKTGPLTVEEVAGFADTNPRELLVSLGSRVERKFIPLREEEERLTLTQASSYQTVKKKLSKILESSREVESSR